MINIREVRIVEQNWDEDWNESNSGWMTNGWYFKDTGEYITPDWQISEIIHTDKYGNPTVAIAEKITEV